MLAIHGKYAYRQLTFFSEVLSDCTKLCSKFSTFKRRNVTSAITRYNCALKNVVNKLAPIKIKNIKNVQCASRFDQEHDELRKNREKLKFCYLQ